MTTEMNDVTNHQPNRKSNDENIMAMLIYLLSLFTSIIGPLIIWLLKKDESKLVDRAGKNYLNYTISYIIWSIVLVVITLIGVFLIATDIDFIIIIGFIITFIGILSIFAFSILSFVFTIIECVKYYNGQEYIIPLTIRFI
ncbi:membrane protein [Staphylococcus aureus]|uniref:DUF4870 domain-containing protein n=1 Tax=Staphylococcus aureus TaxID=1280 RepID=UPI0005DE123A|nr:DUF4870 domain-containing protein [Staphylococcus aureus]CPE64609.1 membrane protein [Staphylococcus aureus]HCW9992741.1 DUF4870 domain-containing protein [Staphylococcus aureus]